MGMNYYYQYHTETGRAKDLHIGKLSYGWEFSFYGFRGQWAEYPIRSLKEWKMLFKKFDGKIFNESDELISIEDLLNRIEKSRDKNHKALNHTIYCQEHHPEHAQSSCWLDEDGWSFTDSEFS